MMQNQQLAFGMDTPPGFGCGRAMSVSEYARRRGVSHFAVQRAIKDGRLTPESVVTDPKGHPKIIDPVKADEEWDQHTQIKPGDLPARSGEGRSTLTLETIRERKWKAKLAELEYRRRSGELIHAKDTQRHVSTKVVGWRNAVLGIPSRVKQLIHHLTRDEIAVIDGVVRETLEQLADDGTWVHAAGNHGLVGADSGGVAVSPEAEAVAVGG